MKRILPWFVPTLIILLGMAYSLIPRFGLAANQLCEMLSTGNVRGLLMFFHSAGSQSFLISTAIGVMAFLIPVLKPEYLFKANTEYFGLFAGSSLTLLSGLIALMVLWLMGQTLWLLLPAPVKVYLKKLPFIQPLLLVTAIGWFSFRLL